MSDKDGGVDIYLLRMERALLASESLYNNFRVFVDSQVLPGSSVIASRRGVCSSLGLAERFRGAGLEGLHGKGVGGDAERSDRELTNVLLRCLQDSQRKMVVNDYAACSTLTWSWCREIASTCPVWVEL